MLRALSRQFPENSDAGATAGEFVRVLEDIRIVLAPVLGNRGVAALLQRSLHRAGLQFPWLATSLGGPDFADLAALQIAVARQEPAPARAAVECALHCFHALLTSLIGAPLTERLFDSVWAPPPRGRAAQETQP
jgi:hypothetical protein